MPISSKPAVSICLATYDKAKYLERVLGSIYAQSPPFLVETVVVDDGSPNQDTRRVCLGYPVRYYRIDRPPVYRNPSAARNAAYRTATGDVLICQSDDVEHRGAAITDLVTALRPGTFTIATVRNVDWNGDPVGVNARMPGYTEFTGLRVRRPLFFLGALYRTDLYAVGGNEEQFTSPGREDVYFADCLIHGRKLQPVYLDSVVGYHLHHERPANLQQLCLPSQRLYRKLTRKREWVASGGPWPV